MKESHLPWHILLLHNCFMPLSFQQQPSQRILQNYRKTGCITSEPERTSLPLIASKGRVNIQDGRNAKNVIKLSEDMRK